MDTDKRALLNNSGKRRPSLKSLAAHLNLSVTTVSRALGDGHRIGSTTIERVKKAAVEMGYVRNLEGLKLRTGNTFVVFALLGSEPDEVLGDSSASRMLYGIHRQLEDSRYTVRAASFSTKQNQLQILSEIVEGGLADGVLLDRIEAKDPRIAYLLDRDVPFVSYGQTLFNRPHPYLDLDNQYAAWQCTQALISRDAKRIGLIDPPLSYTFAGQRLGGYIQALSEGGLAFDERYIRRVENSVEAARSAAKDLLASTDADAVVCANEIVMLGVVAAAKALGRKIGHDLLIASRADTSLAEYMGVPVICSTHSAIAAGGQLAQLLMNRLNGAPVEDCQKIVRTVLVEPTI